MSDGLNSDLETEVIRLREQVAELSRVKDVLEIQKLQSMYAHLYFMHRTSEIPSLFAQKTPGVSLEIEDAGVYEGIEGVKRFWSTVLAGERFRRIPGWLAVHMTVNPIIEVNRAGTMAKGVWFSHGSVAMPHQGKMEAMWCLGKYDMEYVKEDGKWKILKMAYRIAYMCSFYKSWVEEPVTGSITANPANSPDKPTTWHMPYLAYRLNIIPPPPPEPYED